MGLLFFHSMRQDNLGAVALDRQQEVHMGQQVDRLIEVLKVCKKEVDKYDRLEVV